MKQVENNQSDTLIITRNFIFGAHSLTDLALFSAGVHPGLIPELEQRSRKVTGGPKPGYPFLRSSLLWGFHSHPQSSVLTPLDLKLTGISHADAATIRAPGLCPRGEGRGMGSSRGCRAMQQLVPGGCRPPWRPFCSSEAELVFAKHVCARIVNLQAKGSFCRSAYLEGTDCLFLFLLLSQQLPHLSNSSMGRTHTQNWGAQAFPRLHYTPVP